MVDVAGIVPTSRGAHRRPLHPWLASSLFLVLETEEAVAHIAVPGVASKERAATINEWCRPRPLSR